MGIFQPINNVTASKLKERRSYTAEHWNHHYPYFMVYSVWKTLAVPVDE
jgi:hypothetical protein